VTRSVPFLDLARETESLGEELREALEGVLRTGRFIFGPNVGALEEEIAAYLGVRHAVGLNSGTDALIIGLEALGVGKGDEVVTSPFTFVATAEAIYRTGATPVFVDIDPVTFNLDPGAVEDRITDRTRVLLPVHLFGHPADMDPLLEIAKRRGLRVVEDAAQAFGAEYRGRKAGGLADAAAFSFYPTKNLGAYGDGGMLVTDDDEVADRARALQNHGALDKYRSGLPGHNSRLDEVQAAVLRVKLPRVDAWSDVRREMARRYGEELASVPDVASPSEAPWARHVWHQYTIRLPRDLRDPIREKLTAAGIATAVYYPAPLHTLGAYRSETPQPEAERAAEEVLCLPIGPTLPEDTVPRVTDELRRLLP
jgi:dTDP-4-amino-4,6-dideoxygalactose transaminase